MTICWSCKSDIGDLYKVCPICLTMLDEVVCYKCGRDETNVCTTPGHMYGKPLWIESEFEDEEGNWDGNYLCHECWLKVYDHNINPCCICGRSDTRLDLSGKPIWYLHYDEKGEWDEKYICHYCYMRKYGDRKKDNGDIKEYKDNGDIKEYKDNGDIKEYKDNGDREKYKDNGDREKYKDNGDREKYKDNGDIKEGKLEEELEKDRIYIDRIDPYNIQSYRQNIPELIVRDCIREFDFNEQQAEMMRVILLARGVNKWFYARREFVRLRHQVKEMLKSGEHPYNERDVHKVIENIYVRMQKIAKLPRWIWWPITITHKWKKIENKIVIKGRHRDT